MIPSYDESATLLLNILRDLGASANAGDSMLDFGCGSGKLVESFLAKGLEARGVDIKPYWTDSDTGLADRLDVIADDGYRFPYPDCSFDWV